MPVTPSPMQGTPPASPAALAARGGRRGRELRERALAENVAPGRRGVRPVRAAEPSSREGGARSPSCTGCPACALQPVVDEPAGRIRGGTAGRLRRRGARERQDDEKDGGADLHLLPGSRLASRESAHRPSSGIPRSRASASSWPATGRVLPHFAGFRPPPTCLYSAGDACKKAAGGSLPPAATRWRGRHPAVEREKRRMKRIFVAVTAALAALVIAAPASAHTASATITCTDGTLTVTFTYTAFPPDTTTTSQQTVDVNGTQVYNAAVRLQWRRGRLAMSFCPPFRASLPSLPRGTSPRRTDFRRTAARPEEVDCGTPPPPSTTGGNTTGGTTGTGGTGGTGGTQRHRRHDRDRRRHRQHDRWIGEHGRRASVHGPSDLDPDAPGASSSSRAAGSSCAASGTTSPSTS